MTSGPAKQQVDVPGHPPRPAGLSHGDHIVVTRLTSSDYSNITPGVPPGSRSVAISRPEAGPPAGASETKA